MPLCHTPGFAALLLNLCHENSSLGGCHPVLLYMETKATVSAHFYLWYDRSIALPLWRALGTRVALDGCSPSAFGGVSAEQDTQPLYTTWPLRCWWTCGCKYTCKVLWGAECIFSSDFVSKAPAEAVKLDLSLFIDAGLLSVLLVLRLSLFSLWDIKWLNWFPLLMRLFVLWSKSSWVICRTIFQTPACWKN